MTLPTSGQISMGQINTELGLTVSKTLSLNDPVARSLAGKASGQISLTDFWGKSNGSGTVGQYISGGPYRAGDAYMYGYTNSLWGVGGSRPGPAQALGTGGHVVTAVVSDGGENFSIAVSMSSQPVNPPKYFRVRDSNGVVLIDAPLTQMFFLDAIPGYSSFNGAGYKYPALSPVGFGYSLELYS